MSRLPELRCGHDERNPVRMASHGRRPRKRLPGGMVAGIAGGVDRSGSRREGRGDAGRLGHDFIHDGPLDRMGRPLTGNALLGRSLRPS